MAAYNKTIITAKGQALIAKSMVNTDVSFTKVVTSDKDYTSKGNLENLTDIENIKQSELVSEVKVLNKTAVQVIAAFSNSLLTTGYYLRTIGLYATDPDEGEILYSITTALVSDWIPPFGNISITSFEVKLETIVSNSGNIDLNVSPTAVVNVSQFKEFKEQVVSQLSENMQQIETVNSNINSIDTNKAEKQELERAFNLIGQGVTETQIDNAVKKKIDDGSMSSLSVGNNSIDVMNIKKESITRNKMRCYNNISKNLVSQNDVYPGYFNASGSFVESTKYLTTYPIAVTEGDVYSHNAGDILTTFWDSNLNFISSITNSKFTILTGVSYMRTTIRAKGSAVVGYTSDIDNYILSKDRVGNYEQYKVIDDELIVKDENIDSVNADKLVQLSYEHNNLLDKSLIVKGLLLDTNNTLSTNKKYFVTGYVEVEENKKYIHFSSQYPTKVLYYDENYNYLNIENANPFTTPIGCKYIKINMFIENIDKEAVYEGEEFFEHNYLLIDTKNTNIRMKSKWYGKTWNCLGDSITYGVNTAKRYFEFVNDELLFAKVNNYGVGGSAITKGLTEIEDFVTRANNMVVADLITVFGGTNDFGQGGELGELCDTTQTTFYGALDTLIKLLINKFPTSKIVFLTPIHRNGSVTTYTPNSKGYTLPQYIKAIKEVCEKYSIQVIDLFAKSGLCPEIEINKTTYFTSADGTHPTVAGHKKMSEIIISEV